MERMKEIEIFGIPALFTEKRIDHDAVYPGMYLFLSQWTTGSVSLHRTT